MEFNNHRLIWKKCNRVIRSLFDGLMVIRSPPRPEPVYSRPLIKPSQYDLIYGGRNEIVIILQTEYWNSFPRINFTEICSHWSKWWYFIFNFTCEIAFDRTKVLCTLFLIDVTLANSSGIVGSHTDMTSNKHHRGMRYIVIIHCDKWG